MKNLLKPLRAHFALSTSHILSLRSVLKRELPGKTFTSLRSAQAGNSPTAFVCTSHLALPLRLNAYSLWLIAFSLQLIAYGLWLLAYCSFFIFHCSFLIAFSPPFRPMEHGGVLEPAQGNFLRGKAWKRGAMRLLYPVFAISSELRAVPAASPHTPQAHFLFILPVISF